MEAKKTIPIVSVVGSTASGKTALAIEIAKAFDGEIISGDSMQLYKYMDIITAKATPEEQSAAPHHLIDVKEPWEKFSVVEYTQLAHEAIRDIYSRGKLPIIAGGTGLYIRSVLENLTFAPAKEDLKYREELFRLSEEKGLAYVHDMLREIDPKAAEEIHENNVKRVIRALEVYHTSGITFTQQKEESKKIESPYSPVKIGLNYRDRNILYDRINRRVDIMIDEGIVEEAKRLSKMQLSLTASQAIGYKEFLPYFNGECELSEAVETLKINTRHYAKRQLTWFKSEEDINWFYGDDYSSREELNRDAIDLVREKLSALK